MNIGTRWRSHCVLACAIVGQACAPAQTNVDLKGSRAQRSPNAESVHAAALTAAGLQLSAERYRPSVGVTWQVQFSGELDSSVDAELFDIDLFDTSAEQIAALHAQGRKVICYFDTAYEPWRPDADKLEPFRGNPIDGWPGQYWLDTRAPQVVSVMQRRIVLARDKGCDGVEADDIDAVDNDPGFPITRDEQKAFVVNLANWAHALRLAFGMKNALDDVPLLHHYADFAINEECFTYDECELLAPFIEDGKPVLQIEYADGALDRSAAQFCPWASELRFSTLIKHMDLDAARYACP